MKRFIKLVLMILSIGVMGFSQSQMTSGDIKGTILDVTGAVLPNASITVTNLETGASRRVTSDSDGTFIILLLAPGIYELKVEVPNFATYTRRPVQVTVGRSVVINPEIQPAGIQTEVLVQEAAPLLETSKTQQADTITTERI